MGFSRQEYWSGLLCSPPGDLPNPGIEPRSLAFRWIILPSESPGKPLNTGVGSLSLLQGNFLTQELNPGLLHCSWILFQISFGFPYSSVGKESACNAGDPGLIPGVVRSAGERTGYPLQYSGLENSMDCVVHGVAKSRTQLSDLSLHFHFGDLKK